MIQLWLDGCRPAYSTAARSAWRKLAALLHVALIGAVPGSAFGPQRHLLQPGADDAAQTRPLRPGFDASISAQQGHFQQWFARYQLPLLEYLYGMTRDREWAADLVQETFLHAYSAAGRDPTAIEHPQAWLYRIATNAALSALRRKRRFSFLPLSMVEPDAGARVSPASRWQRPEVAEPRGQDVAAMVAERDAVWTVLAELPPRWRAVLLLQTTGGFEVREIAAQLSISEANTRKILFRAKERFRQIHARLEAAGEDEAKGGLW